MMRNVELQTIAAFCTKSFVGHRFGTNFFDIEMEFGQKSVASERNHLKRKEREEESHAEKQFTKKRRID